MSQENSMVNEEIVITGMLGEGVDHDAIEMIQNTNVIISSMWI
jgi:hypothetical protein